MQIGEKTDIDSWMKLVELVKDKFPGLETAESIEEHKQTVLQFIERQEALCVKEQGCIIGVLLFSHEYGMICFLAVNPNNRKQGVATALLEKAISEMDNSTDITLSTYRADDENGVAARALYKKLGFTEGELVEEFGNPCQRFILHR